MKKRGSSAGGLGPVEDYSSRGVLNDFRIFLNVSKQNKKYFERERDAPCNTTLPRRSGSFVRSIVKDNDLPCAERS